MYAPDLMWKKKKKVLRESCTGGVVIIKPGNQKWLVSQKPPLDQKVINLTSGTDTEMQVLTEV